MTDPIPFSATLLRSKGRNGLGLENQDEHAILWRLQNCHRKDGFGFYQSAVLVAVLRFYLRLNKECQGQMNEELERLDEDHDQSEQSDGNQSQLIEIYKLQAQLANSVSNRRSVIHKFYMLLMSGLTLIIPAFFKLPTEIRNLISIEFLILGLPLLGITLSVTWFILISSNLRQSIIKYEALKKLEDKLEYQFFKDEWKYLEKYQKGKTYWDTSYVEFFIPVLFFFIFTLLLHVATGNFPGGPYAKLHYYPGILTGVFSVTGIRSWQIDREIRGMRRWTERTVS